MNMSTEKKEWKFFSKEIEYIYEECIKFRAELERIMNCFEIFKSEYKLLFETNAFYKKYELDKLKLLLGLPVEKRKIDGESIFILNPKNIVEKENKVYHCIIEETGIVVQIDKDLEKVMDYIKNKNVFWVINDIEEIGSEYEFQKKVVLERICFLLRNWSCVKI